MFFYLDVRGTFIYTDDSSACRAAMYVKHNTTLDSSDRFILVTLAQLMILEGILFWYLLMDNEAILVSEALLLIKF